MSVVVGGIRGFFIRLLSRILLCIKYTFLVLELRSEFDDFVTLTGFLALTCS